MRKLIDGYLRYVIYFIRYLPHYYLYDLNLFCKHSIKTYKYIDDHVQAISKITTLYHVIEKGLCMSECRLGFGAERVDLLIYYLNLAKGNPKITGSNHFSSAIKTLQEYREFHRKAGISLPEVEGFLASIESYDENIKGGYTILNLDEFNSKVSLSFELLAETRSSFRTFSNKKISNELVISAIKTAQNSPSSCNRQAARVYNISSEKIPSVLKVQGGARGYDDKINCLLAVGYDNRVYQGVGDRYSGYIDSSLFGMSFIYALTSLGLGTLPLNWSKPSNMDKELRNIIDLPKSVNIVFFIAVGYPIDGTKIANSARSNIEDIYKVI